LQYITPYDAIPYESKSFPQTHPDRIATLGRLFGMNPAPVTHSRVLELGCAGGGNLIPMAFHLPESDFLGIDLSNRQVLRGQRFIDKLSLQNIQIQNASIMDIDSTWGQFDYIIAHGVFSWVPTEIREKIIFICSNNLNPNGIAYVSYNTYPGWHMREMIRHAMLYHANQFTDTSEKIQQARAVVDFLSNAVPVENNHYGILLKDELKLIRNSSDAYLFHDHMEEVNAPIYFHQFIEHANKHNLQYLGEADFSTMLTSGFPKKVNDTLNRISQNIISTEQYMDFLRNRQFRQTLLCHKGQELRRNLNGKHTKGLLIASALRPVKEPIDYTNDKKQLFIEPSGSSVETSYPLTKSTLAVIKDLWPRVADFDDLFEEANRRLDDLLLSNVTNRKKSKQILADDLLYCYTANALEFHTWQADFVTIVSKKPKVSKLAAYQAAESHIVVNQRHETVYLDPVSQHMVPLLDGTKDRIAIMNRLEECVIDGKITMNKNDMPLTDSKSIRVALEKAVEKTLGDLARSAMLVK